MVSQQGGFDRSIFYHLTVVSCAHKLFYIVATNWGEPERAPHKRKVRAACLSVCPYVHDTKIYKNSVIYGVPLVVDSSVYGAFDELLCMPTFNKHVATNKNKQVLILY